MVMRQFVPLTDEMLYSLAGPPMPLVPYCCGMVCRRELVEELEAVPRAREQREPLAMPNATLSAYLPA